MKTKITDKNNWTRAIIKENSFQNTKHRFNKFDLSLCLKVFLIPILVCCSLKCYEQNSYQNEIRNAKRKICFGIFDVSWKRECDRTKLGNPWSSRSNGPRVLFNPLNWNESVTHSPSHSTLLECSAYENKLFYEWKNIYIFLPMYSWVWP